MFDAQMLRLVGYACLVLSVVLLALSARVFVREGVRDAYGSIRGVEQRRRSGGREER